jgi:AbrB family looped-hinge helix DNA binding protein
MTFGVGALAGRKHLVRVQVKGQVTLPADLRRKMGLKKGDLVTVVETPDGVLITPQEVVANRTLDRLGEILRQKGISLDEWIESGREDRGKLLEEMYGIPAEQKGD